MKHLLYTIIVSSFFISCKESPSDQDEVTPFYVGKYKLQYTIGNDYVTNWDFRVRPEVGGDNEIDSSCSPDSLYYNNTIYKISTYNMFPGILTETIDSAIDTIYHEFKSDNSLNVTYHQTVVDWIHNDSSCIYESSNTYQYNTSGQNSYSVVGATITIDFSNNSMQGFGHFRTFVDTYPILRGELIKTSNGFSIKCENETWDFIEI